MLATGNLEHHGACNADRGEDTANNTDKDGEDKATDNLRKLAAGNLENGGRGIGNIIEEYLINPLSRYMFDNGIRSNTGITINDIVTDNGSVSLNCTLTEGNP